MQRASKFILTATSRSAKLSDFVSRRGKGGHLNESFPLIAMWSLGTRVDIVRA
jgi:hypothetical protein